MQNSRKKWLGILVGAIALTGCGKNDDFLYYIPQKEPDTRFDAKVKEIQGAGGVDILWVIDNSGSMATHQQNVIKNASLFMQEFTQQKVSWKMGVISTALYENPYLGFSSSFSSKSADALATFAAAVNRLGTSGDPTEKTFEPILKVLEDTPGFLRADYPLAVIIVTDATEQSTIRYPAFESRLRTLIGKDRPLYTYAVLAATDLGPCSSDASPAPYVGSPYESMILGSRSGKAYSLCAPDFGKNLADIGRSITQQILTPELRLKSRPRPTTIVVKHRGVVLPGGTQDSGGLWYYDYDRNSLVFYNLDFAAEQDETVEVSFETDDGIPFAGDSSGITLRPSAAFLHPDRPGTFEFDVVYESPHDYPHGGMAKAPIVVHGAKQLELFFNRIETEPCCDAVLLRDGAGSTVSEYKGRDFLPFWSPPVTGDRCSVAISADGSVTGYGFSVTKVRATFAD